MPRGTLFWIILVCAVLFGGYAGFNDRASLRGWGGFSLVVLVLIALLGWTMYGPVVR